MRTILSALALCAVAAHATAQAPINRLPQVGPGTRIRVLSKRDEYIGKLTRVDSAGLVLAQPDQGEVTLTPGDVSSIWISGGKRRHTVKGALIGAALGAAVAVAIGGDLCEDFCGDAGVPTYIAVGGLDGGFWGALIGWFVRSERWSPARLPGR